MNYNNRTKTFFLKVFALLKPVLLASLLVAIVQVTGMMGAVSAATQWTLLQAGLRDASTEAATAGTPFDYHFTVRDLKGNVLSFEQFKGKVIFLNLWATWCGPCRAEMPSIQNLYEKIQKDKVVFVMLSIDKEGDIQKVSDYLLKKEFTFQAYMPVSYLPEQLRVPSIPTTFIISKEGLVVLKEVGSTRYDTSKFQKFLEDLSL